MNYSGGPQELRAICLSISPKDFSLPLIRIPVVESPARWVPIAFC